MKKFLIRTTVVLGIGFAVVAAKGLQNEMRNRQMEAQSAQDE